MLLAVPTFSARKASALPLPVVAESAAGTREPDRALATAIPRATYRLQFHPDFTFRDAARLVPYLARLGVSDLYASPIFAATPGSMHGYDVVDYGQINPELGGEEGFGALAEALQEHGIGLLVDFVPNHMGITEGSNPWWQDVLENGLVSTHADTFDIDWSPLKAELRNQVLLPVLGDQFGIVLERGEIELRYEEGAFSFHYHALPLPVAPPTYPVILKAPLPTLAERFEPDDLHFLEYQSVITAFEQLAPQDERDPERIAERLRDQVITKRRLAQVIAENEVLREALNETVALINGTPGDPRSFDDLEALLNAQSYRPAYWRVAAEEINYRRFFAINELAAIRQEAPGVFAATHEKLLDLIGSGMVNGVRIDHPDGLWDPAGYFRELQRAAFLARCQAAAGTSEPPDEAQATEWLAWYDDPESNAAAPMNRPLYLLVEKILEHGESLPEDWPVHGTVGYEFASATTSLFVDAANRKAFDQLYNRYTGTRFRFSDLVYDMKKLIMRVALASEVNVLANALDRITEHDRRSRDFTLNSLRNAMREIIACFPVYRTYIVCDGSDVSERDRRFIERAVAEALRRNPASDRGTFELVRDVLLLRYPEGSTQEQRDEFCHFVMKFQQLSGPVMAKGLEDTAFYIYNRLTSLNEVGGDPSTFGISIADYHRQNSARLRRWPHAMLNSSTHDTKRSEDVRARISALSELPREWRAAINRWARSNRRHKTRVEGALAPNRNDEYLFYQTLIGTWPFGATQADANYIERIETYMLKAIREAQVHTSWISPNEEYDAAMSRFVRGTLSGRGASAFLTDFVPFAARMAHIGIFTSLAQQLLKLTAPGVPDLYQGTELWDFSLVDPDNRRPVDFNHRAKLLDDLGNRPPSSDLAASLVATKDDGRIKLYVTQRALDARERHPDLFERGDYLALEATGPQEDRVVAFTRSLDDREIVVIVPRLVAGLLVQPDAIPVGEIWQKTHVMLPAGAGDATYRNLYTGALVQPDTDVEQPAIELEQVLSIFPVALLERLPAEERAGRSS